MQATLIIQAKLVKNCYLDKRRSLPIRDRLHHPQLLLAPSVGPRHQFLWPPPRHQRVLRPREPFLRSQAKETESLTGRSLTLSSIPDSEFKRDVPCVSNWGPITPVARDVGTCGAQDDAESYRRVGVGSICANAGPEFPLLMFNSPKSARMTADIYVLQGPCRPHCLIHQLYSQTGDLRLSLVFAWEPR